MRDKGPSAIKFRPHQTRLRPVDLIESGPFSLDLIRAAIAAPAPAPEPSAEPAATAPFDGYPYPKCGTGAGYRSPRSWPRSAVVRGAAQARPRRGATAQTGGCGPAARGLRSRSPVIPKMVYTLPAIGRSGALPSPAEARCVPQRRPSGYADRARHRSGTGARRTHPL